MATASDHPNGNGSYKITWWILGALFTVLLLVIGGSFSFLVGEISRIGQLQSVRGERITKVESRLDQCEYRIQRLERTTLPREALP